MTKSEFGALLIIIGFVGAFGTMVIAFILWDFGAWLFRIEVVLIAVYLIGNLIWEKNK